MQRSASTVVCVVGPAAASLVGEIAVANVNVLSPPADQDPLQRAMLATSAAGGAHSPYFVHDADPLVTVARAWVRLFEADGPIGELEVATAETLARVRSEAIELPDYYLVTDADALTPTERHWFFGVLHDAAPLRVVPVPPSTDRIVAALEDLAPSRWWPPAPRLLDGIERRSPDTFSARPPEAPTLAPRLAI